MKRRSVFLAILGGLIYIWTGTLYISVAYTLFDHFDETSVCLITDCFFAFLQVLGYIASMIFMRKSKYAMGGLVPVTESVFIFASGAAAFLYKGMAGTIVLGSIMSFFIGTIMCYSITRITSDVVFSERGKAFGIIYAVGSVGSLVLSLLDGGEALGECFILILYAILAIVSAFFMIPLFGKRDENVFREEEYLYPVKLKPGRNDMALLCIVFMFFVLSNIGLHFKVPSGAGFESAVFSRAFYAVGLIVAGYINDRSRKTGAFCAFLALGFGLISPALRINAGASVLVQALAYVFLGLPAVYRMIAFSDESERDHSKLPFATLGVAAALMGQAVGTLAGIWLEQNMTVLVCVMLVLYILTGAGFFVFFPLLYPDSEKSDRLPGGDRKEMAFEQYVGKYGLNSKQAQVLKYILDGESNCEIAEKLFVAESTVKYHVKNILQATSCHNRGELIEDFRNHYLNP